MAQTCYRHPDRETGVSCSNCGRPICTDCMTTTSVGMRCPECARERTRVTAGAVFGRSTRLPATYTLIGLNVLAFIGELAGGVGGFSAGGKVIDNFGLTGPAVASGDWYRILTAGFLHAGPIHLLFNMFALYILGGLLEPGIGTPRFVAVYFASLFAGSLGVILLQPDSTVPTVGASGAIFGLFTAAFVIARGRGFQQVASQLGLLLVINFVFTLSIPGISIGGHLGGAIGGFVCALAISAGDRGMLGNNRLVAELAVIVAVGALSAAAALLLA